MKCTTHFSGICAPEVAAQAPPTQSWFFIYCEIVYFYTVVCFFHWNCYVFFEYLRTYRGCAIYCCACLCNDFTQKQALRGAHGVLPDNPMPELQFVSSCDLESASTLAVLNEVGLNTCHKHHFSNILDRFSLALLKKVMFYSTVGVLYTVCSSMLLHA